MLPFALALISTLLFYAQLDPLVVRAKCIITPNQPFAPTHPIAPNLVYGRIRYYILLPPLQSPAHPFIFSPHPTNFALSHPCSHSAQKIKWKIQYSTTNAATIMPLSLNIATLFPDAAMRVSRLAEPLRDVAMLEKVSFCILKKICQ